MTETELKSDEMERENLQKMISQVETALAVATPGTRGILQNALNNATGHLASLEKKIHDTERERQEHAQTEVAVVEMAQQEARLSQKEKETYSGFLKESFFTKRDFGKLDEFYAHSWDRLSEGGKQQMSHRIWEGIRRDEYTFTELPKSAREKETDRAYSVLKKREVGIGTAARIPEADRDDFFRAYESGKRDDAQKVLERESFKKEMFRGAESREIRHSTVEQGKAAQSAPIVAEVKAGAPGGTKGPEKAPAGSLGDLDLSGVNLGAMKPAANPTVGAVATLPKKPGVPAREC